MSSNVQHLLSYMEELPKPLMQNQVQAKECFEKEAESLLEKIEVFENNQSISVREILTSLKKPQDFFDKGYKLLYHPML
jgi:hypothetical protein